MEYTEDDPLKNEIYFDLLLFIQFCITLLDYLKTHHSSVCDAWLEVRKNEEWKLHGGTGYLINGLLFLLESLLVLPWLPLLFIITQCINWENA